MGYFCNQMQYTRIFIEFSLYSPTGKCRTGLSMLPSLHEFSATFEKIKK